MGSESTVDEQTEQQKINTCTVSSQQKINNEKWKQRRERNQYCTTPFMNMRHTHNKKTRPYEFVVGCVIVS